MRAQASKAQFVTPSPGPHERGSALVVGQNGIPASPEHGSGAQEEDKSRGGLLVVNADDWGRDARTTDRILDCSRAGAISSASAMVFMEDSERAAAMASENCIETALHLNFTSAFSDARCPAKLLECQERVARHLLRHRLAPALFHPGLRRCFEYLVIAQIDEYRRLYGGDPARLDGHHHMHLSANVLLEGLLPEGTIVRRNFSFQAGEKSICNRLYRKVSDRWLGSRHRLADYFFSIVPLHPDARLRRIYSLACTSVVELETHPIQPDEYQYLAGGKIFAKIGAARIAPPFAMSTMQFTAEGSC